jgi:transcription antitermination factor NusG
MMPDEKAQELINIYEAEINNQSTANFRSLYQDCADLEFPRENKITSERTAGEDVQTQVIDPTGQIAALEMANGLSVNLFPPGQKYYNITMSDKRLNEIDSVKRVLGIITEISHERRADSNFMTEANNSLLACSVFGTMFTYSEYIPGVGLNYIDYDVGQYVFFENQFGRVDSAMIKYPYTVKQAFERWGENAGPSVMEKMKNPRNHSESLDFLRVIRPREQRNRNLRDGLNLPFESIDINVKDAVRVDEGGFMEFPGAIARWTRSSGEKWGRGQGTIALPSVRMSQAITRDFIECGNKWNNPAREVLNTFEGEVRVTPNANNWVEQMGSIKAIDQGVRGNFPITKDVLEMQRDEIKKLFMNDVFIQLRDLKGDRRNELEIRARLAEGLQRLGNSFGRLQDEWLTPLVTRDIMLLQRNGELPELPPEMQGANFKIEYTGRLAMELKSQSSRGWLQWVQAGAQIESIRPGILDNVDMDTGYRNYGETLGVSVDSMASEEEREFVREERRALEQAALLKEGVDTAAGAYKDTKDAAEPGSPAAAITGL